MGIPHPRATCWLDGGLARELGEVAVSGLLFPFGCSQHGYSALLRWLAPASGSGAVRRRTPVLLVHGYGGSRTNWLPLQQRLARVGFDDIRTPTYDPVGRSLAAVAGGLVAECRDAMDGADARHVLLVGHSLGGLLIRYAVAHLGLGPSVRTAVTVATPRRGTSLAWFGCGRLAASLRPGSSTLEALRRDSASGTVRWVAYYSDDDVVVRPDSARLGRFLPRADDVCVPGVGHLGILRAPAFLDHVVPLLLAAAAPSQPDGADPLRQGATSGAPDPTAGLIPPPTVTGLKSHVSTEPPARSD